MGKRYTGLTEKTMQNRATGAGAYFRNYNPATDTVTSAITANKLIGATSGGGNFKAVARYRNINVDGAHENTKGLLVIDGWNVNMLANLLEVTPETLKEALGPVTVTTETTPANYKKIAGKNTVDDADYTDNITFIGNVSGFDTPIIIQVFNAISKEGLDYATKENDDTVLPINWTGNYSVGDQDNAPFAIWVPIEAPTGGGA